MNVIEQEQTQLKRDLAERFPGNPILRPDDIEPSIPGMKVECLLNPGAFIFNGRVCLLLRVAERPEQEEGKTSLPIFTESGEIKIMEFQNDDPDFDHAHSPLLRSHAVPISNGVHQLSSK